jgi:hypothetical protein
MNNHQIDYSWEDKVNSLVNSIIIKLYREHNPDKIIELEKLVKKRLENI